MPPVRALRHCTAYGLRHSLSPSILWQQVEQPARGLRVRVEPSCNIYSIRLPIAAKCHAFLLPPPPPPLQAHCPGDLPFPTGCLLQPNVMHSFSPLPPLQAHCPGCLPSPTGFLLGDGQASCPAGRILALRGSRCWPTTSRWGRWGAWRHELSCSRHSPQGEEREGVGGRGVEGRA